MLCCGGNRHKKNRQKWRWVIDLAISLNFRNTTTAIQCFVKISVPYSRFSRNDKQISSISRERLVRVFRCSRFEIFETYLRRLLLKSSCGVHKCKSLYGIVISVQRCHYVSKAWWRIGQAVGTARLLSIATIAVHDMLKAMQT